MKQLRVIKVKPDLSKARIREEVKPGRYSFRDVTVGDSVLSFPVIAIDYENGQPVLVGQLYKQINFVCKVGQTIEITNRNRAYQVVS